LAGVTFNGVGKVYPDGHRAVADLNLEIADGEFMVLVGPSGCGKTTALRMVAGLEEITEGEILVGGRRINESDPRKRDIAMVFQNYALYPHMTIFENIAFPLRSRGVAKAEIKSRVERTAAMLGLEELLGRRPKTLSGGQRQRVAMGRAIVRQPQAFLMDEPLSNLDAKLRTQMRAEISTLQRELGTTTIYVTHDQVEAMTMGTRIAVMRKGVLQQQGSPQELFNGPVNLFVASFIGSPAMNLFQAGIDSRDGRLVCVLSGGATLALPDSVSAEHSGLADFKGRQVVVGIRPDHLVDDQTTNGSVQVLEGQVALAEMLGPDQLVHLEIAAEPVVTDETVEIASDTDAAVVETLEREAADHRVPIVARISADSPMRAGETARIAIQPERLHFFDLQTGASLRR
jgi:multiple sugar transport system ATP-binding protein